MHILYIHGLESSTNCLKVQWLKSLGHTVYNPKIDYKDPEAFFKVKRIAQKNNIDLIIGSSMGGYFAFAIATSTNHKCIFKRPAKEGQLIKIYGSIDTIGRTSIVLKLEARSHNVYDGRQAIILSTYMTFVRIDEQGEPIPISDRVKKKWGFYENSSENTLGSE